MLCYDPIGQGERKQILQDGADRSETAKGRFRPTGEHNLAGVAPILLGQNLATYRIWDGIRSIDYLAGRDDVDASRIGCAGNSGGGLMTAYLMALDQRIAAAASSCFITTTRRKNDDPGPGDAEQNIHAQTAYGMDHADYILMRAPKPTLILAATKDFVPIAGAWETYRQAKRLYTRLGVPERVGLVEADEKHGFSLHLRTGACRWMRRWLLNQVDEVTEPDFRRLLRPAASMHAPRAGPVAGGRENGIPALSWRGSGAPVSPDAVVAADERRGKKGRGEGDGGRPSGLGDPETGIRDDGNGPPKRLRHRKTDPQVGRGISFAGVAFHA